MAARPARVIGALLMAGTLATAPARAEPIEVTSGSANIAWEDPSWFDMQGAGFHLASLFVGVGVPSPLWTCFSGCAPGTVLGLTSVMGGDTARGLGQAQVAVVDGITYASRDSFESWLDMAGTFLFEGPDVVLPPLPAEPGVISLRAPFQFSGAAAGFPRSAVAGDPPLFVVDLVGRGNVDLRLRSEGGLWRFANLEYAFGEPIPEPLTIVLVGTGLVGILRMRKGAGRKRKGAGME